MPTPILPPASFTRHAVCVGMTGSGKTGLCLSLLEDIAAAGTPILAIDPKGDLANLALVFPTLEPAAFRPWVDPGEAVRGHTTLDALATDAAARWRQGLAGSGLGPDDLAAWTRAVEVIVMTPGSDAGRPVDVLTALTRLPPGLSDDPEGLRGYVSGAVGALLGLVDEPCDPLTDPGAILLSRLLGDAFAAGRDLPLDALLSKLVDPPFDRLGFFPVDEVMPPKARTALALKLNNVMASPAFAAWRTGEPLDLDAWTAPGLDGRTPIRVLYLAHLSDTERMFFVTLLMHAVVAWTRRQPGTGELRALVYFDEVFGYLPPHPKDPPSKTPILTLMKQARAVGVGVMLATQNPVDVDYKALSNAGTWFVGRLLTANDRERVLEGLVGSSAGGPDRPSLDRLLAALPPRTFVVRDAHGRVAQHVSRHTLSYLRGPLTRREVQALLPPRTPEPSRAPTTSSAPPPVPRGVEVRWLAHDRLDDFTRAALGPTPEFGPDFRPVLVARVEVRFVAGGWSEDQVVHRLWAPLSLDQGASEVVIPDHALVAEPPREGDYALLPTWIDQAEEIDGLRAALVDQIVRDVRGRLHRIAGSDVASLPGEEAAGFAARAGVGLEELEIVDVVARRGDVRVGWLGIVWV